VLENAWVELGVQVSFDPFRLATIPKDRARALLSAIHDFQARQNDLLLRNYFIGWLRNEILLNPDRHSELWRLFGRLAAKDFHGDLASLMDATTPIVILLESDLRPGSRWAPGFPQVQVNGRDSYRPILSAELLAVVDATQDWWPYVKDVRHTVFHRDHNRIVFGSPEDGFLLQIYDDDHQALLADPLFAAATGTQIADFLLYTTWALAESLYYLHQLGLAIYSRLQLPRDRFDEYGRGGNAAEFVATLDTLISRASP